eukprot:414384-Amphidinium_carterae.1
MAALSPCQRARLSSTSHQTAAQHCAEMKYQTWQVNRRLIGCFSFPLLHTSVIKICLFLVPREGSKCAIWAYHSTHSL